MGKIKVKTIFRLVPLIGDLGRFLQAFTLKNILTHLFASAFNHVLSFSVLLNISGSPNFLT